MNTVQRGSHCQLVHDVSDETTAPKFPKSLV